MSMLLRPFVIILVKKQSVFMFPFLEGPSSEACQCPPTSAPPAGALPTKGGMKSVAAEQHQQLPSKPAPSSPMRLPKDCHRSLGDLKVGKPAHSYGELLNQTVKKMFFYFFKSPRWLEGWWHASCSAPGATCLSPQSILGAQGRDPREGVGLRVLLLPTSHRWNRYYSDPNKTSVVLSLSGLIVCLKTDIFSVIGSVLCECIWLLLEVALSKV